MIIIENLNTNHTESAAKLALLEYSEERKAVPILPDADYFNLFCEMISGLDKSLGVVAKTGDVKPCHSFICS